jgi:hypothetical protein
MSMNSNRHEFLTGLGYLHNQESAFRVFKGGADRWLLRIVFPSPFKVDKRRLFKDIRIAFQLLQKLVES